eukprot:scaffold14224_cov106-Skeletonema_dohrnii-CCMP3373.AAC.2
MARLESWMLSIMFGSASNMCLVPRSAVSVQRMQPAVTLHPESTVCGGLCPMRKHTIYPSTNEPIHSLVDDAESIRIKSLRGAGCNNAY